jgi:DNA polymerase
MFVARLASPTDVQGWRTLARSLRLADIAPDQVVWRVGEEGGLFDGDPPPLAASTAGFGVSRAFVELAEYVILHRSPERFDLLYRLLWRLREEPHLLGLVTDAQVAQASAMRRQVRDAEHKMHAFLRFRLVEGDGPETAGPETAGPETVGPETYVAWFEPPHYVVERGADFFVHRMANLRFSILTPDVCAHWDGATLGFTPGVARDQAPGEDHLEDYWRTYFASVFNPARLNAGLMAKQMPKSYWRNLPEASLIGDMVQQAQGRADVMVQASPTAPSPRTRRRAIASPPVLADPDAPPMALDEVAGAMQACRRCDLWRDATQAVAGVGPAQARLMLVGEQPGDTEDLSGQPFVGPAGQLLDRALAQAGISRSDCYVTNAVKHFKWEPRGKRRLHKTPAAGEVKACRWWLDAERALVRPKVIVALGATAASAVFGRAVSVTKERGAAGTLDHGALGVITVHPSYLLRLPDPATKAAEFERFVQDLAAAHALTHAA